MRVIVLTSSPFGTASLCLPELVASKKIEVAAVVLVEGAPVKDAKAARKRKFRKLREIGLFGAMNGIRIRNWFGTGPTEHLDALCDELNVRLDRVDAIGSEKTVQVFKEAKADLGLSLGNAYIPKRVFNIPSNGMINFHGERLPQYQNAQSIIWPIFNMERETGFTVHEVEAKIDAGRILYAQDYLIDFQPRLKDTVIETTKVTVAKVGPAIRHVCEHYDALVAKALPQGEGTSYTTPTFRQFLTMVRNNRKLFQSK